MKRLYICISSLIFCSGNIQASDLKVLHLSFHKGCIEEIEHVFEHLSGYSLTNFYVYDFPKGSFDGKSTNSSIYNIGHDRAENIWNIHKEYFKEFDIILTSDTTPLARIFLQNGWEKPLLIWVCNRIDYSDQASLDCDFPDKEYYELLKTATKAKNVAFATYMPFDIHYCQTIGIDVGSLTIQPCGFVNDPPLISAIPETVVKEETFFVPPYHNETHFMNLSEHLSNLGIQNWYGRYNGPADLKGFKGIICLPYSWATLSLYENLSLENIYFIPSPKFFMQLLKMGNYFHPNPWMHSNESLLLLSEWYCKKHEDLFVYFDSWEDLQHKVKTTDYDAYHKKIKLYYETHKASQIQKWQKTLDDLRENTQ